MFTHDRLHLLVQMFFHKIYVVNYACFLDCYKFKQFFFKLVATEDVSYIETCFAN